MDIKYNKSNSFNKILIYNSKFNDKPHKIHQISVLCGSLI